MVHVLPVNVCDDRNGRAQFQKRTVAFIGLGDDEVSFSQLGIAPEGVEPPANYHGGIVAGMDQDSRNHRSGGGLAVAPGYGDAVFEPHELGQHFGSRNHRNLPLLGLENFYVVGTDSRRDHHDIGVGNIVGRMRRKDLSSQGLQPLRDSARLEIRAGDLVAQIEQELSNATHPDAADSHEMNPLYLLKHGRVLRLLAVGSGHFRANSINRSAICRVASGLPSFRAASSIRVSRSGWWRKSRTSAASRSGVNSASGIIRAAPNSSSARAFLVW